MNVRSSRSIVRSCLAIVLVAVLPHRSARKRSGVSLSSNWPCGNASSKP